MIQAIEKELGNLTLTKGLKSHSLRRGSAQWANACYKIAIQWLCTRGHWAMDALCKAFAYIGTTLTEDQKIAKRLSGWDPDDDVNPPSLKIQGKILSLDECNKLVLLQLHLFSTCHGFSEDSERCNISDGVENLLFATLLMHLKDVMTKMCLVNSILPYTPRVLVPGVLCRYYTNPVI